MTAISCWVSVRSRSRVLLVLLLFGLCAPAQAGEWAGRPVVQALDEALRDGARIIYSSQLVPPDLKIEREPTATDPLDRAREVLAAHGLALKAISGGVFAVMAAPHTPPNPTAAPSQPNDREPEAEARATIPSEVTVVSSRYTLLRDDPAAQLSVAQKEIQDQPALLDDALRAVRRFPGTAGTEFSSRSYVRGGDSNENLVLLDGAPIADPFHFEGLPAELSLIDPALIDQLDFFSGVLPIEYGGRMSSVTRLHSHHADEDFGGRASLGLMNLSGMAEGALPNADGDWLIAARRGTLDLVSEAIKPDYGSPRMSDGFAQLRTHLGSNTTLDFGALGAEDNVDLTLPHSAESTSTHSEQAQAWISADYAKEGASLSSRAVVSGVTRKRQGDSTNPDMVVGQVADTRHVRSVALSQDARWPVDDAATFKTGWFYSRAEGDYNYRKSAVFSSAALETYGAPEIGDLALTPDTDIDSLGGYAGGEWNVLRNLRLDAGARWEQHDFNTHQREAAWNPRVSLLYRLSGRSQWRLAWGRMSQFATAGELPVDRGADQFDAASTASVAVLGWDFQPSPARALRVELYDKRVADPWPRLESRTDPLALVPELAPDQVLLEPQSAHAFGIDAYMLAALNDSWRGWLSYSGSRAFDRIDGHAELRSWNQRHALGLGLTTDRWGWTWTGVATAHTGWPTTPIVFAPDGTLMLGQRNTERLPWYGTLNIGAQRVVPMSRGALHVSAELTNITDRENICCTEVSFERDAAGQLVARERTRSWLPIVPFATVAWEF